MTRAERARGPVARVKRLPRLANPGETWREFYARARAYNRKTERLIQKLEKAEARLVDGLSRLFLNLPPKIRRGVIDDALNAWVQLRRTRETIRELQDGFRRRAERRAAREAQYSREALLAAGVRPSHLGPAPDSVQELARLEAE